MTHQRSKRQRLAEQRLLRAKALARIDPCAHDALPPPGSVPADQEILRRNNNTYGPLPRFYIDVVVTCRDCGMEEVWTAERQRWWYEVAHGGIHTRAVLCRACRQGARAKKKEARRIHLEGLARKAAGKPENESINQPKNQATEPSDDQNRWVKAH